MLDLTFFNSTKTLDYGREFFVKIIEACVQETDLQAGQVGISVNLVDKAKIQSLNQEYRNKDESTDVLSFPLQDLSSYKNKQSGDIIELGDIFICPDVAVEKSQLNKTSLKEEMQFLTVHGFLHLFGYDHEQSEEAEKIMFDLQDKILRSL